VGEFGVVTLARVAGSVVTATLVLTLVAGPTDMVLVPWIALASLTVTSAVMFVARPRRDRLSISSDDLRASPQVIAAAAGLGVAALCGQSFLTLPPIVVGQMVGTSDAAFFYAALRITVLVLVVDRVFGALYLPAFSRAWTNDRERATRRLGAAYRVVVALGAGASVLCMIFAADLVGIVYGERYRASAGILILLAPFILVTLLNTLFAYGLVAIGEERAYLRGAIRSGALFVLLLVGGTLAFGARGAAVAMVVGEVAMGLWLVGAFTRHVSIALMRPLATSVAVGAALFAVSRFAIEPALWQAPLYAAAFAATVMMLGAVSTADLRPEVK
jgi:O-antigen/teichoic acid export membrane protein